MTDRSASAIANRDEEADAVTPRKPRIALFIATACGLGYLPLAPGTWGSLGGLIVTMLPGWILYASIAYHWGFAGKLSIDSLPVDPILTEQCILALLIALIGVWSASRVAWYLQRKDPGRVVIDEVSGQHLTLLLGCALPIPSQTGATAAASHAMGLITSHSVLNWKYWLVGFILFRVLDVWKPFPARQAESLPSGWGIMADDWVAGVYAGVALYLARFAGL
jgi:phosphatidylglycerophosphatase A